MPSTSPCNFVLAKQDFPQFCSRRAECAFFSRVSLPRANPCASIRRERRASEGIFRFSFASARSEAQGPSQNRRAKNRKKLRCNDGALFLLSEKFDQAQARA